MTQENAKRLHSHYISIGNIKAAKELESKIPLEKKPVHSDVEVAKTVKKKRGYKRK